MTSLYNISILDRQMIDGLVDREFDEATIRDTLEAESSFDQKLEAVCAVHAEMLADAAARRSEAQRLIGLAEHDEKDADRLEKYILVCMNIRGETKTKTPLFSVSITKSTGTIVDDQAVIPVEYMREIPPVPAQYKPDLANIKKAILDGFSVPGARIEHRQKVRIA